MALRLLLQATRQCQSARISVHNVRPVLATTRAFSQYTPLHNDITEATVSAQKTPKRNGVASYKRFTIGCENPAEATKEDFLTQLSFPIHPSGKNVLARSLSRENYQTKLLILTTPSFVTGASWIDDDKFMSQVLGKILGEDGLEQFRITERQRIKVPVIVAVVDRLPVYPEEGQCKTGTEGFAFLLDHYGSVIPNTKPRGDSKANLEFSFCPLGSKNGILERLRMPLANTLFCNGKPSTLFVENWEKLGAGNWKRGEREEKTTQRIQLPSYVTGLRSKCAAVPLTPWRQIASGLGNIIRQVKIEEEDNAAVPASRELEATVDKYFEAMKTPPRTVQVWAVIIPESQLRALEARQLRIGGSLNKEAIYAGWALENSKAKNARYTYLSWLISKGGRLHRVLSGGGGWGIKQGLLSLDPEIKAPKDLDTHYGFDEISEDMSAEDEQRKALGDAAKAGDWIQFFISGSIPSWTTEPMNAQGIDIVGIIPSSIDVVPGQDGGSGSGDFMLFRETFGALTEHGLYYEKSNRDTSSMGSWEKSTHLTKIDLPYCNFYHIGKRKPEKEDLPKTENLPKKKNLPGGRPLVRKHLSGHGTSENLERSDDIDKPTIRFLKTWMQK